VEFDQFDFATKELVWDGPAARLDRFRIDPVGPEHDWRELLGTA
jgi:hypothetical protein